MIEIKLNRLPHGEGLPLPNYSSEHAAGLDVTSAEALVLNPGERHAVATGFAIEIPHGYEVQVRPRSGLAARHGISVLNTPGTIDSDYRGEIHVILVNFGSESFAVERGQRIAQLVIAPICHAQLWEAKSLGKTRRGTGGFGSTGNSPIDKRRKRRP
jgi:dUTP pyrophosphatase